VKSTAEDMNKHSGCNMEGTQLRYIIVNNNKKNSMALVCERTMPTERPSLVGEVVPSFADRGCCVVSATDSPGR
jgi:hypothetical protein